MDPALAAKRKIFETILLISSDCKRPEMAKKAMTVEMKARLRTIRSKKQLYLGRAIGF